MAQGDLVSDIVPGMADAIEARRNELGLSVGSLADAAGLTRQGLAPLRAGLCRAYNDATIFGLAGALRWPNDWYARVRRGEPPMDGEKADDPEVSRRLDELERQAEETKRLLAEILQSLRDLRGD